MELMEPCRTCAGSGSLVASRRLRRCSRSAVRPSSERMVARMRSSTRLCLEISRARSVPLLSRAALVSGTTNSDESAPT